MMSKVPAQRAPSMIVTPGEMLPDDARVASGPGLSAGGFPATAGGMHAARTWFSAAWARYLRANFATPAAVSRAFSVDDRTARDWWHGRAAPSGVFVAHAFALTPQEAVSRLTGRAATRPGDDLDPFDPAESRWTAWRPSPCQTRQGAGRGIRGVWAMMRAALIALALAGPVAAHGWYDATCCDDRDCAPVPDRSIVATPQGFEVTLMPGDHPLIRWPLRAVVPFDDPRINWSKDARQHACIATGPDDYQGILCIYVLGAGA